MLVARAIKHALALGIVAVKPNPTKSDFIPQPSPQGEGGPRTVDEVSDIVAFSKAHI